MMNSSNSQYAKVDIADVGGSSSPQQKEPLVSSVASPATDGQPEQFEIDREFIKGELQPPEYRDAWFARAFLLHLVVMVGLCIGFASGALSTVDTSSSTTTTTTTTTSNQNYGNYGNGRALEDVNYNTASYYNDASENNDSDNSHWGRYLASFISTLLICLILAPTLAIVSMKVMHRHAIQLIKSSLIFGIGLNILIGILILAFGDDGGDDDSDSGAFGPFFVAFILAIYARAVWNRIPFAAANIRAAITAVQAHLGMAALSLAAVVVSIVWTIVWFYTLVMVSQSTFMNNQVSDYEVTDDMFHQTHEAQSTSPLGVFVYILLLLSFYWTLQVISNVVHTSVAGTVGTWWFVPDDNMASGRGCCSSAVTDSMGRAMTYSFGSICFGSLIVAILEVIRNIARSGARNRRGGILRCLCQYLLLLIERLVQYFNRFAFCYVGIYGYDYIQAAKNVMTLFQHRGWTTIISDSLTSRMMGMVSFLIGIVTALVCLVFSYAETRDWSVVGPEVWIALIAGWIMSGIVFRVILSSIDTILVLFAEAPQEFHANHPALARELQDAWTQTFPDIFSPAPAAIGSEVV